MSDDVFESDDLPQWVPEASVRMHNGEKIPVDAEFFVEPPESIGEIVSAQTTLRESKSPMSLAVRLMLVVGLTGLMFYGIVLGFRYLSKNPRDADLGYLFGGIAALITLPATIYFTRFRHTCSYVGKQGLAEFTLSGSRSNPPRDRVLLFANSRDVTTWQHETSRTASTPARTISTSGATSLGAQSLHSKAATARNSRLQKVTARSGWPMRGNGSGSLMPLICWPKSTRARATSIFACVARTACASVMAIWSSTLAGR